MRYNAAPTQLSLVALVTVFLVLLGGASAQAYTPPLWSPIRYIDNYRQRAVDCPGFRPIVGQSWIRWQTYAAGVVGSRWTTVASSSKLCAKAEAAGRARQAFRHLAGWPNLLFPRIYAVGPGGVGLTPKEQFTFGAPSGWRCYELPSGWAVNAATLARKDGQTLTLSSGAFGAAQGNASPYNYCLSAPAPVRKRGRRGAKGRPKEPDFIVWGPSAVKCDLRVSLHGENEDKTDPTALVYPSFFTVVSGNAVSYYDVESC